MQNIKFLHAENLGKKTPNKIKILFLRICYATTINNHLNMLKKDRSYLEEERQEAEKPVPAIV